MADAQDALARAYAACGALARSHYENFPVASRLLPAAMRPHIAALYAYARVADDLADEGTMTPLERRVQLDRWQRRLHAAVAAEEVATRARTHEELIVAALAHSIRTLDLPLQLFDDLVSAFAQDTMTTRYDSWDELLDYCRRSANPVGRLVLRIAGYRDRTLDESSDALCTALQLTNFWQDFGRDWRAGRIYVPRRVQAACGAVEPSLDGHELDDAWAQALAECVAVTNGWFDRGRAVCDGVRGRLRYELRATWVGGRRMLLRVDRVRRALLTCRPTLGIADLPALCAQMATWS